MTFCVSEKHSPDENRDPNANKSSMFKMSYPNDHSSWL